MDFLLTHGIPIGLMLAFGYLIGCGWLMVIENRTYAREMARHRRTRI